MKNIQIIKKNIKEVKAANTSLSRFFCWLPAKYKHGYQIKHAVVVHAKNCGTS